MVKNCRGCGKDQDYPTAYKTNLCDDCSKPKALGFPTFKQTMKVGNYGNVSIKRIDELARRRILPYEKSVTGKDYIIGRMGENGKIQEREPDYSK